MKTFYDSVKNGIKNGYVMNCTNIYWKLFYLNVNT